jgi:hypothetical protein
MRSGASVYERLETLLLGPQGDRIRDFDRVMGTHGECIITVILTSKSSRLSDVGALIARTDRELRRAVNIIGQEYENVEGSYYFGTVWNRPRPISVNEGGLQVADASTGSLHLLVKAYGDVLALLTSKPLAALTALVTLSQSVGNIRFWPRRHQDPLDDISARQLLNVIKELGGDPANLLRGYPASLEIQIEPAPNERIMEQPETARIRYEAPIVHMVDKVGKSRETIIRGRQITYIRDYPDGSREVIFVDG